MKITYLADHQEVIPILSDWFYREWSYLHPERSKDDVAGLIAERINRKQLPLALVAFEGAELIGTVCLKSYDMDTRPELTPWLAGLYIKGSWRRKGVGSALVNAIEHKAFEIGIDNLYLYTPESEHFYSTLGWIVKQREKYHNVPVTVMEKEIIF